MSLAAGASCPSAMGFVGRDLAMVVSAAAIWSPLPIHDVSGSHRPPACPSLSRGSRCLFICPASSATCSVADASPKENYWHRCSQGASVRLSSLVDVVQVQSSVPAAL